MTDLPPASAAKVDTDPASFRKKVRANAFPYPSFGRAPGKVHCNIVCVPRAYASEFENFCRKNVSYCPILARSDAGSPQLSALGDDMDIRSDIGSYRLFRDGQAVVDVMNIQRHWQPDLVTFALGSAYSLDGLLAQAGLALPHVARGEIPAHYLTDQEANATGAFRGLYAVSMRPVPRSLVEPVYRLLESYPKLHGAPLPIEDPKELGITSLDTNIANCGPISVADDEVPIFWTSSLSAHMTFAGARMPFCITNTPGYTLVCDMHASELKDDVSKPTGKIPHLRLATEAGTKIDATDEKIDLSPDTSPHIKSESQKGHQKDLKGKDVETMEIELVPKPPVLAF